MSKPRKRGDIFHTALVLNAVFLDEKGVKIPEFSGKFVELGEKVRAWKVS